MVRDFIVAREGARGAKGIEMIGETIGVNVGGIGNLKASDVNQMARMKMEAKKQTKFASAYVKHLKEYAELTKEIEAKRAEAVRLGLEASDAVWKEVEQMEKHAAKMLSSIAQTKQKTDYALVENDAKHGNQMNYLGQMHQVNLYDLGVQMDSLLAKVKSSRDIASLGKYMDGGDYDPFTIDVQAMNASEAKAVPILPNGAAPVVKHKSLLERILGG